MGCNFLSNFLIKNDWETIDVTWADYDDVDDKNPAAAAAAVKDALAGGGVDKAAEAGKEAAAQAGKMLTKGIGGFAGKAFGSFF